MHTAPLGTLLEVVSRASKSQGDLFFFFFPLTHLSSPLGRSQKAHCTGLSSLRGVLLQATKLESNSGPKLFRRRHDVCSWASSRCWPAQMSTEKSSLWSAGNSRWGTVRLNLASASMCSRLTSRRLGSLASRQSKALTSPLYGCSWVLPSS